jgi:hypothetical protein
MEILHIYAKNLNSLLLKIDEDYDDTDTDDTDTDDEDEEEIEAKTTSDSPITMEIYVNITNELETLKEGEIPTEHRKNNPFLFMYSGKYKPSVSGDFGGASGYPTYEEAYERIKDVVETNKNYALHSYPNRIIKSAVFLNGKKIQMENKTLTQFFG